MKILLIILILSAIVGCGGPSAYDLAKQDIQRQYSELDQVQDLELRKQKFAEIQQRELMLELKEQNDRNRQTAVGAALMGYGAAMNPSPKTYNVNIQNR